MAEATVKIVVASDGLSYKAPGQDKPGARETYVTLGASRGDEIEVDKSDAERFFSLGHAVEPGTPEAAAAQSPKMAGEPYGAVRIASEHDNTPVQKLRAEAIRRGAARAEDFGKDFLRDHPDLDSGDDGSATAVSGDVPDGLDLSNEKALGKLSGAQLKKLAEQQGVEVESGATKKTLAAAIVKKNASSS